FVSVNESRMKPPITIVRWSGIVIFVVALLETFGGGMPAPADATVNSSTVWTISRFKYPSAEICGVIFKLVVASANPLKEVLVVAVPCDVVVVGWLTLVVKEPSS